MNDLLAIVTKKGGFDHLTKKEGAELDKYTKIVKAYEDMHYTIPLPQTVQGLIELKMFENKLKQKDLAKMLNTTDTKLSEIMHNKRKPSISLSIPMKLNHPFRASYTTFPRHIEPPIPRMFNHPFFAPISTPSFFVIPGQRTN